MTAAAPDPRSLPYPLGRRRCCGAPDATACHQRGLCWMEGVHPDSPGYRATAVPDPRFRDQLAEAVPDWCGLTDDEPALLADALMPTIAAEVKAQVQAAAVRDAVVGRCGSCDAITDTLPCPFCAAAKQRAAEALRELLAVLDRITVGRKPQALEDAMEAARAALASPAPAPRAEEGQR